MDFNIEFNELESFLMVVKYKNFSKAGQAMYLSQPTISHNIQSLESKLNTVLLDRKGGKVSLTGSGEIFYDYALEMINLRKEAKYSIEAFSKKVEGNLKLPTSSIPEQYILPYIIRDFLKEHPKVNFTISHENSDEIARKVVKGLYAYGIVGAKYQHPMLDYQEFFQDELVLALANIDKYEHIKEGISLDLLKEEDFILREQGSGTRTIVEDALREKGFQLNDLKVISYVESNELIKKMVELGLGLSFLSNLSIKNEIKLGSIRSLRLKDLEIKRKFYFVSHKNRTLSPLVQAFKDFLLNYQNKELSKD